MPFCRSLILVDPRWSWLSDSVAGKGLRLGTDEVCKATVSEAKELRDSDN